MYFEFEKLDVYQAALEFIELVEEIVRAIPALYAHRRTQLLRSADSIADNIAEGVGEFASIERRRFLRMSRRSALEAASQVLRIGKQNQAPSEPVKRALEIDHRIVSMLTPMCSAARDRRAG